MKVLRVIVACSLLFTSPAGARFHRSHAAKAAFARMNPCPATGLSVPSCPGYVIDHIVPLCAGGSDTPDNMQWQEYEASLVKDNEERRQCRLLRESVEPPSENIL